MRHSSKYTHPYVWHTLAIIIILMLNACSSNGGKITHGSVETVYPEDFNVQHTVSSADFQTLDIESFGIMDFKISNSLLFVATTQSPGIWHSYSLPTLDSISRMFDIGSGPLDLPMPLPCAMASFNPEDNSELTIALPKTEAGKLLELKINTDTPTEDWQENVTTLEAPIGPMTIWCYTLGNDMLIQAKIIPDSCKIVRTVQSILTDSILPENPAITLLNHRKAETMANIPEILTRPAIRPDGNRIAEIPGFENEILIYDPFSEYFITVRYPEVQIKKDSIKDMAMRGLSLFGAANAYEDFFAVLRNRITDNRISESYIDFISWEGKPLGTIRFLQSSFRYFDIDLETNTLYILDTENDQIQYIDLTQFFDSLKQFSATSRQN